MTKVKYADGTEAHLGDRVRVGDADTGVVVASLDNDEFSAECPKSDWEHLETGVVIRTDRGALVHLSTPQPSDVLERMR
ncbi:MAG: hypothetical protein ACREP9_10860 [Candidatus Dormibacteraceae bacterium]